METLKAGQAEKLFSMMDSQMQADIGGLAGCKKWMKPRKPLWWKFNSIETNFSGQGQLDGELSAAENHIADFRLVFSQEQGNWLVIGVLIKTRKGEATPK